MIGANLEPYKMRASIQAHNMGPQGIWLGFEDFDDPPSVPLPGELVELYDEKWGTLWVGKVDTVHYQKKIVYVQCDWAERAAE
jgi:hypothetical protein